jgi:transglutaminase-like putative cysteine protease
MRLEIPPTGNIKLLQKDTSPEQVQKYMVALIDQLRDDSITRDAVYYVLNKSKDFSSLLQNIANYVYDRAYFEPDPMTKQILRTPGAVLRDRRANCVDYTIFIGAMCAQLGLPVTVRIVRFGGAPNFGHVYPIVNGYPVDVVPGQEQTGKEHKQRKNGVQPKIGVEVPYVQKKDLSL